jgi:uncharacterized protein DUF4231
MGIMSAAADGAPEAWKRLADALPVPTDPADRADLLWQHLAAQVRWYHRAAARCRWSYQVLKVAALVAGGAVTVLAATDARAAVTASLAAAAVVMEGVQQVFQFHANWLSYRDTAETLRQHALLYAAGLPPYAEPETRRVRLAENVEAVTIRERGHWRGVMRQGASPGPGGNPRGA